MRLNGDLTGSGRFEHVVRFGIFQRDFLRRARSARKDRIHDGAVFEIARYVYGKVTAVSRDDIAERKRKRTLFDHDVRRRLRAVRVPRLRDDDFYVYRTRCERF